MATLTWALLFVLPYAVLTVAGVLLWKRSRSVAAFLVALGFAAALLGQVAGFFVNVELSAAMRNRGVVGLHLHGLPWLAHYLGIGGIWVAAVGLLWHVSSKR